MRPVHAFAAKEPKAPLAPFDFDLATPASGGVVVRVLSCGVCHSDLHMLDNDWACTTYPFVPGHEVVGVVEEVGAGVTHLRKGDRVGVGWQRSSCGCCDDCVRGEESLCEDNRGLIVGHHGGFADFVEVDARFAFKLPDGIDTNDAGPLLCGGITVYSALRHAGIGPGKRVGVIGLGGLGHLAVRFAAALGCRTTVFTTTPEKVAEAGEHGAHEAIVARDTDWEREPASKLDIILNTASGPVKFDRYVNALDSDGTLSLVGVGAGKVVVPFGALMAKRRRVMASPIGGTVLIREMLRVADTLGVRPQTELFPMSEANAAFDKLRANKVRYRAVLTR